MSCNCGKSVIKKSTGQVTKKLPVNSVAKRTTSIKRVIRRPAK